LLNSRLQQPGLRCSGGLLLAIALSLVSCRGGEGTIRWLETPAPPGSSLPDLVAGDAKLALSWVEGRGEQPPRLRYAFRLARDWGEERTVVESERLRINWANFPSLVALDDGSWAAQWAESRRNHPNAHEVAFSASPDGEQWTDAVRPSGDRVSAQRGWGAMIPEGNGGVGMAWLDGRAGTARLIYRRWSGTGFGPETTLDDDVCPWCRVSAVRLAEDLLVAYRDHEEGELRDVALVRRRAGEWEAPRRLHRDDWRVATCPINGPDLSASGDRVAAAWFTAAGGDPRLLVALSSDGELFGEPVRVDGGDPLGRVDVEMLDEGTTFVSWLEKVPLGAEVRLRRLAPDGALGQPRTLGVTEAGADSGFPRMAHADGRLYVAWTEPGPPSRIRLASLRP
jgi:hypothetical protein